MTAEVFLTPEQEEKFFTIYHNRKLNCTNQELIQDLFNEALTANYLLYGKRKLEAEIEPESRLTTFEITDRDNDLTPEEEAEILREVAEREENELNGN